MNGDIINIQGPSSSPQIVGQAVIYRTPSASSRGRWHFTLIRISDGLSTTALPEPIVECTCPGFQNHDECWHLAAALEQFARDTEGIPNA